VHGHEEAVCPATAHAAAEEDSSQPEAPPPPKPQRRKRFRELIPRYSSLGFGWCWTCGRRGHMAGECGEAHDTDGRPIADWDDDSDEAEIVPVLKPRPVQTVGWVQQRLPEELPDVVNSEPSTTIFGHETTGSVPGDLQVAFAEQMLEPGAPVVSYRQNAAHRLHHT
jgi:hypothetical protein